jgi:nucleotide-binding universal stress UspA family protein
VRLYRRILHATDLSRASAPAFARAVDLARRARAMLLVVHVLTPPSPFIAPEVSALTFEELDRRARRAAERQLARLGARARRAGVRARVRLVAGMPAEEIVRQARRARADLIVIGTHARTGLARAFLGSVAQRVLRLAPCPVLSVRGRR